jgi:hypothetical protein
MLEKIALTCPNIIYNSAQSISSRLSSAAGKVINIGDVNTARERQSEAVSLLGDVRRQMTADLVGHD